MHISKVSVIQIAPGIYHSNSIVSRSTGSSLDYGVEYQSRTYYIQLLRKYGFSYQKTEKILEANPDVPLVLFWDRAPWHRGKAIDQVLAQNPRLEIIFFPTASPDLNPQEHVWKAVRKEVSHNHLEARLPQLADRFLNKLNSNSFKTSFLEKYGYSAIYPTFI
jgi:transposase